MPTQADVEMVYTNITALTDPLKGKMAPKVVNDDFKLSKYEPAVARTMKTKAGTGRGDMAKTSKVYSVSWGGDSDHICTCTQSGHLMVYKATEGAMDKLPVKAPKVMQCAMSKKTGGTDMMVAGGGMDNKVTVYKYELEDGKKAQKKRDLYKEGVAHDGYISQIHFVDDDTKVLTGSGDGLAVLWDITSGDIVTAWKGHDGDVTGVATCDAPNIFGTSSTDKTCRMWDKRMPYAYRAFTAKYAVNCCDLMPEGKGIVGGCDNASWEYFDVGCNMQVRAHMRCHWLRSRTHQ